MRHVYNFTPACAHASLPACESSHTGSAEGPDQIRVPLQLEQLRLRFSGGGGSKQPPPSGAQSEENAVLAADLRRPIAADNRGSQMLRDLGWEEGTGIGAHRQGRLEPIAFHKRQKRQGLGADT